jgi:hypothetical protein
MYAMTASKGMMISLTCYAVFLVAQAEPACDRRQQEALVDDTVSLLQLTNTVGRKVSASDLGLDANSAQPMEEKINTDGLETSVKSAENEKNPANITVYLAGLTPPPMPADLLSAGAMQAAMQQQQMPMQQQAMAGAMPAAMPMQQQAPGASPCAVPPPPVAPVMPGAQAMYPAAVPGQGGLDDLTVVVNLWAPTTTTEEPTTIVPVGYLPAWMQPPAYGTPLGMSNEPEDILKQVMGGYGNNNVTIVIEAAPTTTTTTISYNPCSTSKP